MPSGLFIIEYKEDKKPHNTRLTLDLDMLKQLIPLINEEILQGKVETSGEDKLILHINLSGEKLNSLRKFVPRKEKQEG